MAHSDDYKRNGLIHGIFTPLAGKIAIVKRWPGINPEDVDAALATAMENGTVAGYEGNVADSPFLDIGVTVYRESIPATTIYARERTKEAWGARYTEWDKAYAQGVDDVRVKAIPGAKLFTPNRIVIEATDFGANWNRERGTHMADVQRLQAGDLADFAVIYNAVQSPPWVEQMDGENVPHALVAALHVHVPRCTLEPSSPYLYYMPRRRSMNLNSVDVAENHWTRDTALPVLRKYS